MPGAAAVLAAVASCTIWVNAPSPTLTTSVPPAERPSAGRLPWVSTFNYRIVDDQGRYLALRGFNQDFLLDWPSWQPAPFDERDAELMQAAGFNVVRLPIAWSRLEPVRGQIDSTYLDQVAQMVAMLNRHDLYVVFDMHFSLDWGPRFGGAGAPTWAVVPRVPVGVWQLPNASWKVSPGIVAAQGYFWTSPDWQADFAMAWQAVATRFRNDSGVVGYDLFNEPEAFPIPAHLFEEQWMWPLFARTIDAIGSVDPFHLFLVEGILFWDFPTTMDHLLAPNLVFAPHVYTGALVPPDYPVAPERLPASIRSQDWEAKQLPAATWVGELGIDFSKPYALAWTDAALDTFEQLDLGWAWWQWRDIPTWGVRNLAGTELNLPVLHHLARPFIAAAPVGVRGGHGDGVLGHLSIDVAPDHLDQPAVVSWPALTLAAPSVTGTCVAASDWDATRSRLELQLVPGVGCTIELARAGSS